ncbi:MAG TPA: type II secretion system protein [Smithellaceae bacterium]|nr:type II secretion system protein [Smithellaceae bacterium]HQP24188.1 type II secretion system protein [Smithellaceae bacterium]
MIRTSITGKLNKRGFTLIELIVVVGLIGVILALAVPTTRDILTVNNLKKVSRQIIGLERQLRVEAVRDQMDYLLVLDIPGAGYYVITSDMTPEKKDEMKKNAKKFPAGVAVLDIINQKGEKISEGTVKIKFGRNNICSPRIIHLGENEERMTLVLNPFLGVAAVYDQYVEISPDDGFGQDIAIEGDGSAL